MSNLISVAGITIKIKDATVNLTVDEAKALRDELNKVFEKEIHIKIKDATVNLAVDETKALRDELNKVFEKEIHTVIEKTMIKDHVYDWFKQRPYTNITYLADTKL